VRELIDAGADITFKDDDGRTALQWAAKLKHRDVVALLLARAKELKNANK
jgi:ankyrin repeat protein